MGQMEHMARLQPQKPMLRSAKKQMSQDQTASPFHCCPHSSAKTLRTAANHCRANDEALIAIVKIDGFNETRGNQGKSK
jgi:hypothetical protein